MKLGAGSNACRSYMPNQQSLNFLFCESCSHNWSTVLWLPYISKCNQITFLGNDGNFGRALSACIKLPSPWYNWTCLNIIMLSKQGNSERDLFSLIIANQLYPKLKPCSVQYIMYFFFFLVLLDSSHKSDMFTEANILISQHSFSTIQTKRLFVLFLIVWHAFYEALRVKKCYLLPVQCPLGGLDCQAPLLF